MGGPIRVRSTRGGRFGLPAQKMSGSSAGVSEDAGRERGDGTAFRPSHGPKGGAVLEGIARSRRFAGTNISGRIRSSYGRC